MNFSRREYIVTLVAVGLCFFSQAVFALLFEPGVGAGLEHTNNATLVSENEVNGLTTIGYVGAHILEDEGALTYDAAAVFNNRRYTPDTSPEKRYFGLGATADWEMVRDRFNWFLRDYFNQRTINSLNSNTPENLQNSNAFTFGANIRFPISRRQSFSLVPTFHQYYYESSPTNNKQYALVANWNYQMFRLTNVGFNFSARKINYTEDNLLGLSIEDTTFTNMAIIFNGQRLRSIFTVNLGATNVKRENGQEATGFSGYFDWLADLSSRSKFQTLASTALTDTSSRAALTITDEPADSSSKGIQITSDVIRSSMIYLAYMRQDATLGTRISTRYEKVKYSDNPLDRIVRDFRLRFSYPVTQLLSSDAYAYYYRTKQLETERLDKTFIVGGNLRYDFSRKLGGLLDLRYRKKESTFSPENYDEYSVFVSLVYGFGSVSRPTSAGGF